MHDEMITGKIYFLRVPIEGEYEDFIAFLVRCAVDNQIWINTGEQIRNPDARYKYSIDNSESNDLAETDTELFITEQVNNLLFCKIKNAVLLRKLSAEERFTALDLAWRVFSEYESPDYS